MLVTGLLDTYAHCRQDFPHRHWLAAISFLEALMLKEIRQGLRLFCVDFHIAPGTNCTIGTLVGQATAFRAGSSRQTVSIFTFFSFE